MGTYHLAVKCLRYGKTVRKAKNDISKGGSLWRKVKTSSIKNPGATNI